MSNRGKEAWARAQEECRLKAIREMESLRGTFTDWVSEDDARVPAAEWTDGAPYEAGDIVQHGNHKIRILETTTQGGDKNCQ